MDSQDTSIKAKQHQYSTFRGKRNGPERVAKLRKINEHTVAPKQTQNIQYYYPSPNIMYQRVRDIDIPILDFLLPPIATLIK